MFCSDFTDKIITGELKFVFGSDTEADQEYTKDVLSMLSGGKIYYYDSSYNTQDPQRYGGIVRCRWKYCLYECLEL